MEMAPLTKVRNKTATSTKTGEGETAVRAPHLSGGRTATTEVVKVTRTGPGGRAITQLVDKAKGTGMVAATMVATTVMEATVGTRVVVTMAMATKAAAIRDLVEMDKALLTQG